MATVIMFLGISLVILLIIRLLGILMLRINEIIANQRELLIELKKIANKKEFNINGKNLCKIINQK